MFIFCLEQEQLYCGVIALLSLLGVNHHRPLLDMYKTFIYIISIEKRMNQFEIGYMVNSTLHVNMVFK